MRGREFIMKDAYSFHADTDDCRREYQNMFAAYKRIFSRFGLRFRPVEADTGAIGGTQSHEFQVLADSGEDAVASCSACEYAANLEKAEIRPSRAFAGAVAGAPAELKKVSTPGKKSVSDVAQFLQLPAESFIKTLVYSCDGGELVAVLARGDHEVNETKLKSALGCREIALADDATVRSAIGVAPGFLGPVGMKLRVVADQAVQGMRAAVTGANESDTHYVGVDQTRDFLVTTFADLRLARAGDPCPRCERGVLEINRGIEVGQVFYLGSKYSQAMGANYLDADGRERPLEMGCYGIGISRLMAAAIEQNHDANGIIWPFAIAPAHVLLVPVNYKDKSLQEVCDRLYEQLQNAGMDVLFDDRDERPGVKFKDADLVGIPLRITVGPKGLEKGCVELRRRRDGHNDDLPVGEAAERVRRIVEEALGAP
jgi:prolyl-tRNA synthetase